MTPDLIWVKPSGHQPIALLLSPPSLENLYHSPCLNQGHNPKSRFHKSESEYSIQKNTDAGREGKREEREEGFKKSQKTSSLRRDLRV
jgi:hypothetical protein